MRIVICEKARVDELEPLLAEAGVTQPRRVIEHMAVPRGAANVEWVGLPPSPDGGTFTLIAPIEGADMEPEWRAYSRGDDPPAWNYTRDLIAFGIDETAEESS